MELYFTALSFWLFMFWCFSVLTCNFLLKRAAERSRCTVGRRIQMFCSRVIVLVGPTAHYYCFSYFNRWFKKVQFSLSNKKTVILKENLSSVCFLSIKAAIINLMYFRLTQPYQYGHKDDVPKVQPKHLKHFLVVGSSIVINSTSSMLAGGTSIKLKSTRQIHIFDKDGYHCRSF